MDYDLLSFNNTDTLKHLMINDGKEKAINGDITLKTLENVAYKNATNKDDINMIENEVLK